MRHPRSYGLETRGNDRAAPENAAVHGSRNLVHRIAHNTMNTWAFFVNVDALASGDYTRCFALETKRNARAAPENAAMQGSGSVDRKMVCSVTNTGAFAVNVDALESVRQSHSSELETTGNDEAVRKNVAKQCRIG